MIIDNHHYHRSNIIVLSIEFRVIFNCDVLFTRYLSNMPAYSKIFVLVVVFVVVVHTIQ